VPLSNTAELVADAADRGRAIVAFNAITLEHVEGIVAGAERAGQPVILQLSENAVRFHGGRVKPLAAAACAVAETASAAVSLHLDHIADTRLLEQIEGCGISSVMVDASTLPYRDNVALTRKTCEWAHQRHLYVEAELGEVGGKDGAHAPGARTDPKEAAEFVEATGVDALAVAVGSSHAMTSRTMLLDRDLISSLRSALSVPLVLHGSSGVADEELRRAVRSGITKVNVGTLLNVAYTTAVRDGLVDPSVVDPRKYLERARTAMAEAVAQLLTVLG
jgi:fructose-bisphosphate aldolase class II